MGTFTIAKRDFGAYFRAPVAYIVLTIFLLISGFLFFDDLFRDGRADLGRFFGNMPLILIFFAPAITMGLLAEERGSGSIELLTTFPVRDWEIVLGKYLAACALYTVGVIMTLPYYVTMAKLGNIDHGPALSGYLGLLMLGYVYLAIGLMASALTRHQIIAFIVGFGICFIFYLFAKMVPSLPGGLKPIAEHLSVGRHFQKMVAGMVEPRTLIYFVTLGGLAILVAWQSLESRRWS